MLLYLREVPFLRILKGKSNSIYPTFYPTQKKRTLIISVLLCPGQESQNAISFKWAKIQMIYNILKYNDIVCI